MPSSFTTMEEIEAHFLRTLHKKSAEKGVNYSELVKACGDTWKKQFAQIKGLGKSPLRQSDGNELVHRLWAKGLIAIEPPAGRQRVHRMWSTEAAAQHYPHLFTAKPPTNRADNTLHPGDLDLLKTVYDDLARDHAGGYVPIYRVRRSLEWPRAKFDRALRDLNERRKPVIELHGGDPQSYSEEERADSLMREMNLYLRMRWRD
jgi:hypothetical protein